VPVPGYYPEADAQHPVRSHHQFHRVHRFRLPGQAGQAGHRNQRAPDATEVSMPLRVVSGMVGRRGMRQPTLYPYCLRQENLFPGPGKRCQRLVDVPKL